MVTRKISQTDNLMDKLDKTAHQKANKDVTKVKHI